MFEKIARAILNYFLHLVAKDSDANVSLDLKEINGKYVLGISSTVALATKLEPIHEASGGKNIMILFLVSLSLLVVLDVLGILFFDATVGRTLVYLGEFPAILVNIIGARYIIRNYS